MVYRKEGLLRKIEKLREYAYDLKAMEEISFDEYSKDKKSKYSIERLLFLVAENILDFLDHLLSSRFEVISDSYENIIENAYKQNLLENSLYSHLKGLGGFRNVLAHEYLSLSDDEVFKNFTKMCKVIDQVIEGLEKSII